MRMILELRAFACLLLYPDEELLESFPEINSTLQGSASLDSTTKDELRGFFEWAQGEELTSLQSAYVATFDIGKHASLNLFEHTQGDSRDRGTVMVELSRLYREHGLDLTTTELPDHLPVFLEFLSGLKEEDAQVWLESTLEPIAKIDRELQLDGSPWEAITAGILNFAGAERTVATERPADEMVPSPDAEYFEAPITFGGSVNPVG